MSLHLMINVVPKGDFRETGTCRSSGRPFPVVEMGRFLHGTFPVSGIRLGISQCDNVKERDCYRCFIHICLIIENTLADISK